MYATMPEGDAQRAARKAWRDATPRAGEGDAIAELTALTDRVCAESAVWAPDVAVHALRQARGDASAAAGLVRVWAATLPHEPAQSPADTNIRVLRRLTSAFQDAPGGQWLGTSPEMASRLIEWPDETPEGEIPESAPERADEPGDSAPTRADTPRVRDLFGHVRVAHPGDDGEDGLDPASAPVQAPYDRPTALGLLAAANGDVLSSLSVAVMNTRREAILVELEVGDARVEMAHPVTGEAVELTRLPIVQAEVVLDSLVDGRPGLVRGWGATMGRLERRAIAAALVDAAANDREAPTSEITLDTETVLTLANASTNDSFVDHLKLPHYASFAAYLNRAEDA